MEWWSRSGRESLEQDPGWDLLNYPPDSGGLGKLLLLGFGLAGFLIHLGVNCWIHERAYLPAKHGGEWLSGNSAKGLAVSVCGAGLACHARWFWGLRQVYGVFEKLTILACLIMAGGLLAMLWYMFME